MSAYRELPAARELHPYVACRWVREVPLEGGESNLVLPDGCVDLIWRNGRVVIAGPDRAAQPTALNAGETIVGVRLRPGVAGAVLGLPASELLDSRPALDDVLPKAAPELTERLGGADEPDRSFRLLEALVGSRLADEATDPLVLAGTRRLGFAGSRVDELAAALGISERQLRRRFARAVGYGPKTLDRILRFRRLVSRARAITEREEDLARLAADLGYADQAHMTREAITLSGLSPARLAALWAR
jgi:AraC-like DNA-binding protein